MSESLREDSIFAFLFAKQTETAEGVASPVLCQPNYKFLQEFSHAAVDEINGDKNGVSEFLASA